MHCRSLLLLFLFSLYLAAAHDGAFSTLAPGSAPLLLFLSDAPRFYRVDFPSAATAITLSLNFSDGAPPSAPGSLTLRVVALAPAGGPFPASAFRLPAGGAPFSQRCERATHNALRLPLYDPRVRAACGGAPCSALVQLAAEQLQAGEALSLAASAATAPAARLPANALLAALHAFAPLGDALYALLGRVSGQLDEFLVLLLCAPLFVWSQGARGDRLPAPLHWAWAAPRALCVAGLWVRALRALLRLEEWRDLYLCSVLVGGALALHDAHAGDGGGGGGAGADVWVWHALVAAALAWRRVGPRALQQEGGGEEEEEAEVEVEEETPRTHQD